jgi:RNA polymerase sigma-70 factor (ECF subfamily)
MFHLLRKRSQKSEFEALTLPHLDALYNTALRLTKNESDAEDLIQETFLKAFRFFHRFQPGTHIKAWLFKIMTNTFINHYRKQQRDKEVLEDWDWDHLLQSDAEIGENEKKILDRFISQEVVDSLNQIPVEFRMVVLLADLEDFSYKEIAEIVDCPIGTVMSRLYRGRRLLRKLLAEYATEQGYIQQKEDTKKQGSVTELASYRKKKSA